MRSVQELIASGKVPANTVPSHNRPVYPDGWPIFVELTKQVEYDWNSLPSDRVRLLRQDSAYRTALEAFLTPAVAPAQDASSEIPTAAAQAQAASPEEAIINAPAVEEVVPAAENAVVPEVAVEEPPVPAAPAEEADGTKIEYPFGTVEKVKGGWEARVDNKDGSGVQVYKSKTLHELIGKLMQAHAHASAKIREQEAERLQRLADEPADVAVERRRLAPRKMTADEQFEFGEAMSSGDPVRINKAMAKRDEIILGGAVEEVIGEVNKTRDELELAGHMNTAKSFIRQNPDFLFTQEVGAKMDAILLENNWAYTVRNLNKALAILQEQGEVTKQVSTPEPEIPVPTSAAVPVAPAAPAPKPAVAPAVRPAPPKPTPAQVEGRLRPGSASTGVSPRQASVRQGATPVATVGLTAEEYNRMSVSDTRRKYKTDPGFRSAVDKLIAEGRI